MKCERKIQQRLKRQGYDIMAKTNEGFAMDIQKLKELNQAIQDNPTMPERIKDLVQQQTQSIEYLNACVEMNTQLANQMQADGCVVIGGERVYPTNGRTPALPIPKHGYIDSNGIIVIPIKQ